MYGCRVLELQKAPLGKNKNIVLSALAESDTILQHLTYIEMFE